MQACAISKKWLEEGHFYSMAQYRSAVRCLPPGVVSLSVVVALKVVLPFVSFSAKVGGRSRKRERECNLCCVSIRRSLFQSFFSFTSFQSCACPVLPLIPTSLVGSLRDCDTSSVQKRSSVAERWWWTLNRRLCLRKVCCSTEVGFYKKQSYFARGDFFGG